MFLRLIPYTYHHHPNYPGPCPIPSPTNQGQADSLGSMSSIWPCQPSAAFCGLSGNVVQYVGHKHFMSKRTERNFSPSTSNQVCSLPFLFVSFLGDKGVVKGNNVEKVKTALSTGPLRSSLASGLFPQPLQCQTWNNHPCHGEVGRPGSRRLGFEGPKILSCLGQAAPPRSSGLEVPRHFTQIPRKDKR